MVSVPLIRVLVVNDSASVRELLIGLLRADGRFEVVGTAADGEEAVAETARLRPAVVTMDIHMPRLDGLGAIRRIMAESPTPIVVVSGTVHQAQVGLALEALEAGAVAACEIPPGPGHARHRAAAAELLTTIRLMSGVRVVGRAAEGSGRADPSSRRSPRYLPQPSRRPLAVALAASTGGPQAIQVTLQTLGAVDVPLLAVQHISPGFAAGMAAWLCSTCPQPVRLAEQGEVPPPGTVLLAPQGHHLTLSRRGTVVLSAAPPVRGFRPSANVLFEAVAECYGARAVGVILSGMSDDGAAGLSVLRAAGATTIAQDEATSVIYGMPGAAVALGAVQHVLPLAEIGPALRRLVVGPEPAAGVA